MNENRWNVCFLKVHWNVSILCSIGSKQSIPNWTISFGLGSFNYSTIDSMRCILRNTVFVIIATEIFIYNYKLKKRKWNRKSLCSKLKRVRDNRKKGSKQWNVHQKEEDFFLIFVRNELNRWKAYTIGYMMQLHKPKQNFLLFLTNEESLVQHYNNI